MSTYLDDIRLLGITKMLGYLPLATILSESVSVQQMMLEADSRDMKTFLFSQEDSNVFSGALYVADITSLNIFLNLPKQKNILKRNNWPLEANAFVNMVSSKFAHSEKLFELVAFTFSNSESHRP